MARLSLRMIVRDKEPFLEGRLASVRGLVDETRPESRPAAHARRARRAQEKKRAEIVGERKKREQRTLDDVATPRFNAGGRG